MHLARYRWSDSLAALVVVGGASVADAQLPTLSRVATIGCESCRDARELASIEGLFVAPNGDVVVTDASPPMIRRFDPKGRIVWSGGGRGRGPGEYLYPLHVATSTDGGLQVFDMSGRRITALAADGTVRRTVPFPAFAGAATSPPGGGAMVMLSDDFAGSLTLYRWRLADSAPTMFGETIRRDRGADEPINLPTIAMAPDASIAVISGAASYRILRFDPGGQALTPITRDVERERRTPEELAELNDRMRMLGDGRGAAEARAGGRGTPNPVSDAMAYKPHFSVRALQYDGRGRLWVLTMRGPKSRTVFDVFAPSGSYLGEVTVPIAVTSFAIGGSTLATGTETADGVPQVIVWDIR